MKTMYERIRDLRMERNMSQDDLARAMGYSDRSMITKIEGGKVDISQKKIVAFAEVLGTTPRYLMDGDPVEEELEAVSEDQQILFRLARNAKPEAIRAAVAVLKSMEGPDS
ncbi:MAG: helix-turn-helix transcriptional regulator [Lachnospiraceae bacterium]|nr:helix-turn-helix transcriptional regulator [Lachnospiraceae bacterium]